MLLEREKRILAIGGGAAAVLLVVAFLIFPAVSRLKSLARASTAAESDLAEVRRARPELERIRRDTVAAGRAPSTRRPT